jgi:hypothetical protein
MYTKQGSRIANDGMRDPSVSDERLHKLDPLTYPDKLSDLFDLIKMLP